MKNYYNRFIQWLNIEDYNKDVSPYQSAEMSQEPTNYVLLELNQELSRLKKENLRLKEKESLRRHWLDEAKEQAGYNTNTSFDVVWNSTLELANKYKEQQSDQTSK